MHCMDTGMLVKIIPSIFLLDISWIVSIIQISGFIEDVLLFNFYKLIDLDLQRYREVSGHTALPRFVKMVDHDLKEYNLSAI